VFCFRKKQAKVMPAIITQLWIRIAHNLGHPRLRRGATDEISENMRHLVWEFTLWGVVVGFMVNFLNVYTVRLGASSLLVSAVTYGPTLIVMLGQLPVANLLGKTGHRMKWMLGSMFTARLFYLLIALLPFFISERKAELTVLLIVLQAFPGTVAGVSSLAIFADSVPSERIAGLQGKRMAAYGLSTTLSNLIAGQVLLRLPFSFNYQVLFIAAFLASLGSTYHLSRLTVRDYAPISEIDWNFFNVLNRTLRYRLFTLFIIAASVFHVALGMLAPLVPLYLVRLLKATDYQYSLLAVTGSTTVMVSSLIIRKFVYQIKPGMLLVFAIAGHGLYPLLFSIAPSIYWIYPFSVFANIFGAAIGVSLFADLVKITPLGDRTEFIGVYVMSINAAVFLSSLFAGFLAKDLDYIVPGIRLAGLVNLSAALIFWLLQKKKRQTDLAIKQEEMDATKPN